MPGKPILCICGHTQLEHTNTDGTPSPCQEPTQRCACTTYIELCPRCKHRRTAHTDTGPNQLCSVRKADTKMACGCTNYVTT